MVDNQRSYAKIYGILTIVRLTLVFLFVVALFTLGGIGGLFNAENWTSLKNDSTSLDASLEDGEFSDKEVNEYLEEVFPEMTN